MKHFYLLFILLSVSCSTYEVIETENTLKEEMVAKVIDFNYFGGDVIVLHHAQPTPIETYYEDTWLVTLSITEPSYYSGELIYVGVEKESLNIKILLKKDNLVSFSISSQHLNYAKRKPTEFPDILYSGILSFLKNTNETKIQPGTGLNSEKRPAPQN